MDDKLPPLPKGAVMDMPPLPKGATLEGEDQGFFGKATKAIREAPFPEKSLTAPIVAGGLGGLTKGK